MGKGGSGYSPGVMTVQEAADYLRIGRNTCYQGIRRGEIPALRICGRILLSKAAIDSMLACSGDPGH